MREAGLGDIKIVSLFCGAGGMDLGFEKAGFRTVLALDKEPAAVRTYNHNRSRPVALQSDLGRWSPTELSKILRTRVRGVIGGPPCQGFSKGNVLRQADDPRNGLVFTFADIVKHLNTENQLDFFVLENVDGLRSKAQRGRLERLITSLSAAGFVVSVHDVNASDFGVPQVRKRLLLVGLNAARFADVVFTIEKPRCRKRTVRDAIAGMPEPTYFERGLTTKDIPFHVNHWTMQPNSARFTEARFNKWRSFRRLDWDKPSPTVAYGNREIHVHPSGHRRLSILEAMMLQGFPRRYAFSGNLSEQVTQVSNAVPPPLAYGVARSVKLALQMARK